MKNLNFQKDILPFIIATFGEFAALTLWLYYQDQGQALLANVLLWAGFLTERTAVILWLRRVYRPLAGVASEATPVWLKVVGIIAVTLSEILIWILWLYIAREFGHLLGAVVLMVLMQIEHSAEMSFVKKKGLFHYMLDGRTLFFTFMEVLGAVVWLYLWDNGEPVWGMVALFIGLSIEHVLQGGQLKPKAAEQAPAAV